MRKLFDSWEYLFKNAWFVLPFAILPAVFLALSVDYTAVHAFLMGVFTGDPRMDFGAYFRTWSLIRIDSVLGGIWSVLAFVTAVLFGALMAAFVEKHMRIGKRTLSGVPSAFLSLLPSMLMISLVYVALYELWALIVSALFFAVASFESTALVYIGFAIVFLGLTFVLFFVSTVFYLWLPCRQSTGFRTYEAMLYSYRLMIGVRRRILVSFLISYAGAAAVLVAASLLPGYGFRLIAMPVYLLLFTNFFVRMETLYFETDKLDREDILHSYREY